MELCFAGDLKGCSAKRIRGINGCGGPGFQYQIFGACWFQAERMGYWRAKDHQSILVRA